MERQYLVRTLTGRTVVMRWPSGSSAARFVQEIQEAEGVQSEREEIDVRLSDGSRLREACIPDAGSTLQVTMPLMGGKGGFGKAIRDMGRSFKGCADKGDCRDEKGRRIRRVVGKVKDDAPQRELAKLGESYVKKAEQEALQAAKEGCVDENAERRKQREIHKETSTRIGVAISAAMAEPAKVEHRPKKKAKKCFADSDDEST